MRDLSLHILDIIQNSITAGATVITVYICQIPEKGMLNLEISDNGAGMEENFLKRVEDPFTTSRTTRKTGLGIPLLKESAMKCEGQFSINSKKDIGTKVFAAFSIGHIDRLPVGDIGETMLAVIASDPDIRFILHLESTKGEFKLDTDEIKTALGGVRITEAAVLNWLKEYIGDGIKNIFGGVLNEINS